MRIPTPIQPLAPTHAAPVTPAQHGPQVHLHASGLAASLANAHEASETTRTGLAAFNANAKITLQRQAQIKSLLQRATKGHRGSAPRADDADALLEAAANNLAGAFSDGDEEALEEQLGRHPDPLQRHTLLKQTRALLEKQAAAITGPRQGTLTIQQLIRKLDRKLEALLADHGEEIEAGMAVSDSFSDAMGELEQPDLGPVSGSEATEGQGASDTEGAAAGETPLALLRAQLGAKGQGKFDQPITPQALFAALLAQPGAGNLKNVLAAGRNRLTGNLKSRGKGGPKLWLSLSDAACFTVVQTCSAVAGDLRRDLSDKEMANLAPQADESAMTMLLLRAGEPERDKAASMMQTLVGPESATPPQQRAKACKLLRTVLADLPPMLSQGEAKPRLQALCADLDAMQVQLHATLAAPPSETDTFEQGLRATRRAMLGAN